MREFYYKNGHVRAWINDKSGWLVDLYGNALALIHEDGIFDRRGRHIAWWYGDQIRDHQGNVLLITRDAWHVDVRKPVWKTRPLKPVAKVMPTRPTLDLRPEKPQPTGRWADAAEFLDVLTVLATQ